MSCTILVLIPFRSTLVVVEAGCVFVVVGTDKEGLIDQFAIEG